VKLEQLREKQAIFQAMHDQENVIDIKRRLKIFQQQYPIEYLEDLNMTDYVYGRYQQDHIKTFCYWMEKELGDFGLIAGSPCSQYGLWFGTHGNDKEPRYRHTNKYGSTDENAFAKILQEIKQLYAYGVAKDYRGVANSMIADKFKGKILTTYFPDIYISIYADFYLNDILRYVNLDQGRSNKEAPIYKQLRLQDWKAQDKVMRHWNLPMFAMFINQELYTHCYEPDTRPDEDQSVPKFPELCDLEIGWEKIEIDSDFLKKEKTKPTAHSRKKPDYPKKTIRNMAIGIRGEQIVKEFEQRKLVNFPEWLKEINWISEKTDGQGYDIDSFETDGTPMQIEVKSTTKKFLGKAEFYLTEFERSISTDLSNYYLYYLSDVLSNTPIIYVFKAPFDENQQGVVLSPTAYFVEINQKS
jgi:hypothetical protein